MNRWDTTTPSSRYQWWLAGEFDTLVDRNHDGTFHQLLEKVLVHVRAKAVRIRHPKAGADDVTSRKLECRTDSDVVTEPGLDIPEEELRGASPSGSAPDGLCGVPMGGIGYPRIDRRRGPFVYLGSIQRYTKIDTEGGDPLP